MAGEERFQAVADVAAVRGEVNEPLVEHDADADVTAFEWNPPTPPAIADDVVGGGAA